MITTSDLIDQCRFVLTIQLRHKSLRKIGSKIGISPATLMRFVKGRTPTVHTLYLIQRYVNPN